MITQLRFSYWGRRRHGDRGVTRAELFWYVCQDFVRICYFRQSLPFVNTEELLSVDGYQRNLFLLVHTERGTQQTRLGSSKLVSPPDTLRGCWSICAWRCSLTESIITIIYYGVPQCSAVIAGYIRRNVVWCVSFVAKRQFSRPPVGS
jgi:hypothetical protein